ncbi:polyphosphate polymerase domain-containing protein [uncultured Draconibacterium sp.]|uniref:polyphosphate polymerase domain-containing protein n=1 Tax=uncultured Draconibacterium sp. TaxID=1573823 RepID=UPI003260D164
MQGYTELNTFRYERKFVAHPLNRLATEAIIKQNNAFFISAFSKRRINNIYFDTPGFDCYFDNLFGNGNRWKVRLRWYGDEFGKVDSPILEFKIKKGLVGTKKSYSIPSFYFNKKEFHARALTGIFDIATLPADVREKLTGLQPVLFNTYLRSYYTTLNKVFRITVDDQMEYYNLRPSWNHMQHSFKEDLKVVVELKYNKEHNENADQISNQFPFRLDKNSKFVSGLSHFRSEIAH